MLRDTRKSDVYFANYLKDQEARIERFQKKLDGIPEEAVEKRQQCHRILANLVHDKFYAQYSAGIDLNRLRQTYNVYAGHLAKLKELTYNDWIEMLSLAIALDSMVPVTLMPPEDMLIESLLYYAQQKNVPQYELSSAQNLSGYSQVFMDCLTGNATAATLREYLDHQWYEDHRQDSWFDSHLRTDDTYCGYWCFLSAAVVKMLQYSQEQFCDSIYYPQME